MATIIIDSDSDDEYMQPAPQAAGQSTLNTSNETTMASEYDRTNPSILKNALSSSKNIEKSGCINTNTDSTELQKNPILVSPPLGVRHHRRKSTHQMVRSSDMEFIELVPIESSSDEEADGHSAQSNTMSQNKVFNLEEHFNNEFTKFISDQKTLAIIKEIAMERLRINTLLKLNKMPKVRFALYTQEHRLKRQIRERFRNRLRVAGEKNGS